jgi:hypothetical protein
MSVRGYAEEDVLAVPEILDKYIEGMASLDATKRIPEDFTPDMMRSMKTMVSVLNKDASRVAFSANGEFVKPTQRVAAHVDAALRPIEEEGIYEGRLEMISVHGAWSFNIYDEVTGEKIPCHFAENLLPTTRDALRHRVAVKGTARRTRSGAMISVRVDSVERLREEAKLTLLDLRRGVDITGGVESSEYVRGLRDA